MKKNYPANRCKPGMSLAERLARYTAQPNERGCKLWTATLYSNGYGLIRCDGHTCLAHRKAWEAVNGPIPDGLHVCHSCDVRACINVDHLWLGTVKDNVADMDSKGRANRPVFKGMDHGFSKLTDAAVREIFTSPLSATEMGQKFGVNRTAIVKVRSRETWCHVTDSLAEPAARLHGNSRLNPAAVRSIRADDRSHIAVAADYGVSDSLIGLIRRRKIWNHVE